MTTQYKYIVFYDETEGGLGRCPFSLNAEIKNLKQIETIENTIADELDVPHDYVVLTNWILVDVIDSEPKDADVTTEEANA